MSFIIICINYSRFIFNLLDLGFFSWKHCRTDWPKNTCTHFFLSTCHVLYLLGDTSSTVSALCYTVPRSARGSSLHALESGSDYKSRSMNSENRVVLGPGVSMSTCDVMLIDDSEYESSEEFELVLSDASDNARIGGITVAKVIIDGPNDASTVLLGNASFSFSEDAGM